MCGDERESARVRVSSGVIDEGKIESGRRSGRTEEGTEERTEERREEQREEMCRYRAMASLSQVPPGPRGGPMCSSDRESEFCSSVRSPSSICCLVGVWTRSRDSTEGLELAWPCSVRSLSEVVVLVGWESGTSVAEDV